jgi:RNA polymerase sigma-70 factor (ECF subfamily)
MPNGLRLRSRRVVPSPIELRTLTDGELMQHASEGLADAFGVLYDRHGSTAFALAYRICGRQADAEDVVQAAFLSLWRGRDRYEATRGEVRGLLLRIVHNSAIDRLRRTKVHELRRASDEGIEERLEAPERIEEEVETREQAARVREALGGLPNEQRHVIELAYFDGLTHTQIAAQLEQPVGTIKGRMRLGLVKLHTELTAPAEASASTEGRA